MKKVLISGISGQDGANMIDYLFANVQDVQIFGMVRHSASPNYENVKEHLHNPRFKIVYGDLSDQVSINKLVEDIQPDYFINFGANSFVGISWDMPMQVFDVNAVGVLRCLEAIRKLKPDCRFYSAGSSEEVGNVDYSPQDMKHPIKPRSPYGCAKAAARHLVKVYRESYQLYSVHGVLYNHEGVRRNDAFITRLVSKNVARIYHEINSGKNVVPFAVGNIYSKRDWSDSEDFMSGVWMMLNQEKFNPELAKKVEGKDRKWLSENIKDYILASGETNSVKSFIELAFENAGIKGSWVKPANPEFPEQEEFISEFGKKLVYVDKKRFRPAEVDLLCGDSSLARKELGWSPKIDFKGLVKKMVENDIRIFTP